MSVNRNCRIIEVLRHNNSVSAYNETQVCIMQLTAILRHSTPPTKYTFTNAFVCYPSYIFPPSRYHLILKEGYQHYYTTYCSQCMPTFSATSQYTILYLFYVFIILRSNIYIYIYMCVCVCVCVVCVWVRGVCVCVCVCVLMTFCSIQRYP